MKNAVCTYRVARGDRNIPPAVILHSNQHIERSQQKAFQLAALIFVHRAWQREGAQIPPTNSSFLINNFPFSINNFAFLIKTFITSDAPHTHAHRDAARGVSIGHHPDLLEVELQSIMAFQASQ